MLYLNSHPVTLPAEASFKYKIASPLFSSKGEFSLDVTIPLRGFPENVRIFGRPVYHPNVGVRYETERGEFRLTAGPLDTAGTFELTASNETEVKVKLTAARQRWKDLEGSSLYIDELDLGFFFEDEAPEIERDATRCGWTKAPISGATVEEMLQYLWDYEQKDTDGGNVRPYERNRGICAKYAYGIAAVNYPASGDNYLFRRKQQTFAFPVAHAESKTVCANDFYCSALPNAYTKKRVSVLFPDFGKDGNVCFQIRLLAILRRVLKAVGLELDDSRLDDFDRDHIVISTISYPYLAQTLPHWTVEEFLVEVGNFLFCTYYIDPLRRTVTPVRLTAAVSGEPQTIPAADPYDTDVNDEENERGTVLAGTVDYDRKEELPNALRFPDDLFEEYGEMLPESGLYPTEQDPNTLYHDTAGGFSTQGGNSRKINLFAPLVRNGRYEADTRLKIIPAGSYVLTRVAKDPALVGNPDYSVRVPVITIPEKPEKYRFIPLARILADEDVKATKKPEILFVANLMQGACAHYKTLKSTPAPADEGARLYQPYPLGRNIAPLKDLLADRAAITDIVPVAVALSQAQISDSGKAAYEQYVGNTTTAQAVTAPDWYARNVRPYYSPYTLTHLFRRQNNDTSHLQRLVRTREAYTVTLYPRAPIDLTRPLLFAGRRYLIKELEYTINPALVRPAVTATIYLLY